MASSFTGPQVAQWTPEDGSSPLRICQVVCCGLALGWQLLFFFLDVGGSHPFKHCGLL